MGEKTKETAVAYRTGLPLAWVEGERPLPPLENGDRLTRAEFERRYEAMPQLKKAELIEGVVYVPSPVRVATHAEPHSDVSGFLFTYKFSTPGVRLADNGSVRIDDDNEPQPDLFLWIDAPGKGQARLDDDDYLDSAPDLIIEIAGSSASYDLHDKLEMYRHNGVREYGVWRTYDGAFDWFRLEGDDYISIAPDEGGVIASAVFPGLWLNVKALLAGDLAQVMADLQAGLQSEEHRQFVEWLAADDKSDE